MPVVVPTSLDEVIAAVADSPDALLLAGGTDVMVEINEGHRRPSSEVPVIALQRVPELSSWTVNAHRTVLSLGAGVRWAEIEQEPLRSMVPASTLR